MKRKPTGLELKVLECLWSRGNEGSVREVLYEWKQPPVPGYTTVLKILQIMEDKGLVSHVKDGRSYRYRAMLRGDNFSRGSLRELLYGFFKGDRLGLVNALVEEMDLSAEEIRDVRKMLNQKVRGKKS